MILQLTICTTIPWSVLPYYVVMWSLLKSFISIIPISNIFPWFTKCVIIINNVHCHFYFQETKSQTLHLTHLPSASGRSSHHLNRLPPAHRSLWSYFSKTSENTRWTLQVSPSGQLTRVVQKVMSNLPLRRFGTASLIYVRQRHIKLSDRKCSVIALFPGNASWVRLRLFCNHFCLHQWSWLVGCLIVCRPVRLPVCLLLPLVFICLIACMLFLLAFCLPEFDTNLYLYSCLYLRIKSKIVILVMYLSSWLSVLELKVKQ